MYPTTAKDGNLQVLAARLCHIRRNDVCCLEDADDDDEHRLCVTHFYPIPTTF
jgi:hypothetical protein